MLFFVGQVPRERSDPKLKGIKLMAQKGQRSHVYKRLLRATASLSKTTLLSGLDVVLERKNGDSKGVEKGERDAMALLCHLCIPLWMRPLS